MNSNNNYMRSVIILFSCFMFYGIISLNLFFIQIRHAPFFKNLADKQHNITLQSHPCRGDIIDRNGNFVAINKDSIAAFILPKELSNKELTIQFLKEQFPQAHQRLEQLGHKNFMFIKRNLSPEEISLISKATISDIHFLKESSRFYPYESLGPIVGITDIDNNGLFGIEQLYNKQLQGTPTTYHLKKDAKQKHFYFEQEITEGIKPQSVTLTIDADLQFKFQEILDQTVSTCNAKEAAAICLDPETGEILAMVSNPNFNPNMTKDIDLEKTKNRPITECFEFGSVFKVFAALAALEEKLVSIDEIIDCENSKETKIDHIRVRTVIPHGKISFLDVIKHSNNIGIVKVCKRVGEELYNYYKLLGFGDFTGIAMPGEQKGFVNNPSNWSAYSIQSLSYGYEVTTTLLHLAKAFSTIINGGYLITPTIVKAATIKRVGPLVSQKTIESLRLILEETVKNGSGRRANIVGYNILGKTGTANLLENGVYNDDKHIYTFMGSVEHNGYKRVIVTYIKESQKVSYASLVAAPLFKSLAEALLLHDRIFA